MKILSLIPVLALSTASTLAQDLPAEGKTVEDTPAVHPKKDTRPGIAPDIREDDSKLKAQHGNFVAVPIPFSNPTLDSGLVAGAAYFYPQSPDEKKIEPASVTALGAMYSSNDSKALGLAQQNYWRGKCCLLYTSDAADERG